MLNLRQLSGRIVATTASAGIVLALAAAPARAHVTVTPTTSAAGAFSVLTVSVPHGCDGSPTTEFVMEIPESILSVTPTRHPMYTITKNIVQLDEPTTDAHGNEVTERVGSLTFVAKQPLPDGYRDAFELSVQIPDLPGETLVFPTVQTCVKGETGWTEVPAEGQDPHELEHPAPSFVITEAEAEGGHGAEEAVEEEADTESAAADADSSDEGGNALGIAGLIAGLAGLAVGGAAFARGRAS